MTQPVSTPASTEPLQFDRAVNKDGADKGPGVTCSMCERKIVDRYYTLGEQPACVSCKAKVERDAAHAKRPAVFARSALFGFGGAVAGAVLYYAVLKLTGYEIGLVAIASGFMIGHAMRKGAGGWGGRRFQLAAAGLTYLSVGMAYLPMAMEGAKEANAGVRSDSTAADSTTTDSATVAQQGAPVDGDSTAFVATDGGAVPDSNAAAAGDSNVVAYADTVAADSASAPTTVTPGTDDEPAGFGAVLIGLGAVLAFSLALPILVIIGSMPGGLISALIILFGIMQAWKMTAAQDLTFHGPLIVERQRGDEGAATEGRRTLNVSK